MTVREALIAEASLSIEAVDNSDVDIEAALGRRIDASPDLNAAARQQLASEQYSMLRCRDMRSRGPATRSLVTCAWRPWCHGGAPNGLDQILQLPRVAARSSPFHWFPYKSSSRSHVAHVPSSRW